MMRGGTKSVPYLPEEEEDVAEGEQGQEWGKVTVRKLPDLMEESH